MATDFIDIPAAPADVRIQYGPAAFHYGDLRIPKGHGPHPVVVVIHGGFWRARFHLERIAHLCNAVTAAGAATWNLEYRRVGNPGGGWPNTLLDVSLGVDHLRELAPEYNLDLSRLVLVGHSAGGHLVLWLAARPRIPTGDVLHVKNPLQPSGVVALAPVGDLERGWELHIGEDAVVQFLGGPATPGSKYATASPAWLLPIGVPQIVIHGTEDARVPYHMSEEYRDLAVKSGDSVRLITLPGAGHYEVINPWSAEWPQVLEAIFQLLKTPTRLGADGDIRATQSGRA